MPSSTCLYGPSFSLTGDTFLFGTAVNFQVEFNSPLDEATVLSYEWFLDDSLLVEEHDRLFTANIKAGAHQIGVRILSAQGWSGIKKLDFYTGIASGSMVIEGVDSLNEGDSAVYQAILTLTVGTIINVTKQCTFTISAGGSFNYNILNTVVDDTDLNDKQVTITATLAGGNTATKPITILNTTNPTVNHPSIIVVDFYGDVSLNAIGFVDNVGVSVNHIPAYTGQNFIPNAALAAQAIVLASDLGPNSPKWRFEFNVIKLIAQYPNINNFAFVVKGRANASGTISGAFSLRTYDAVMTMNGSSGSYMPSVIGGSVLTFSAFSTQVLGGANGDYSEANLQTLIRFNFHVPTDTLTYTLAQNTYYSVPISENVQRDNCGAGYTGAVVPYTLPAAAFSSVISQADADNQARAYFDENKQQYANDNGTCTSLIYVWGKIFEENEVISSGATYANFVIRTFVGGTATTPPADLSQPYVCSNPSIAVAYHEDSSNTNNNFNVSMNGETAKTCYPPGNIGHIGNKPMVYCPGCGVGGSDLNLWLQFQGKAENEWQLLQTI